MLIEFLDSLIFSIYLYSKAVRLFIGHAIELSSKYFTQIHRLFIPLRKSNNAVKLIVSLKQSSSEGFTTNGEDSKFAFKTTKFCPKCPLRNFEQKHELQYLEKYAT